MNRLRRPQSTGFDRSQGPPFLRRSLWPSFRRWPALPLSVARINTSARSGRGESPGTGWAWTLSNFPAVIHRSFHDRQLLLTCCFTWPRRNAEPVRRPNGMPPATPTPRRLCGICMTPKLDPILGLHFRNVLGDALCAEWGLVRRLPHVARRSSRHRVRPELGHVLRGSSGAAVHSGVGRGDDIARSAHLL